MREFIIASLIVGAILIIWDLTRLYLRSKNQKEEVPIVVGDPGKVRIQKYAESFQNLANTFSNMPYRKEFLTSQDLEEIFGQVSDKLCSQCSRSEECWKKNYFETYRAAYGLLAQIEDKGKELTPELQYEFSKVCTKSEDFIEEMEQVFHRAKLNLLWNNRLLENRVAVAEQLNEMANIMNGVADNIYDMTDAERDIEEQVVKRLRMHSIQVKKINVLKRKDKKQEFFITMRAVKGRCISAKEAANALSKICKRNMVPDRNGRTIINQELSTFLFIEDTHFQVLTGVARVTKEGERVSGDNFSFIQRESGQLIMSLSDGMGTGVKACKESEMVIELLEQFLDAGFEKETAVKMINSAMVIKSEEKSFSTIDLCSIDLYSGLGEFLKIGAATTFIRRDNWVEAITSTSLPAGILQQVDYEVTSKKLYNGDFVIIVSDGVLDALPPNNAEEILKEIILQQNTTNAEEMARCILERVLVYQKSNVLDDMTVLTGGIWKK